MDSRSAVDDQQRAGKSPAAALSLLSLPDDVLVRCLEYMSNYELFLNVAPVCRRLRALCLAAVATITFWASTPQRLRSLLGFLAQHGQQLRCFSLEAPGYDLETTALIAGCLAACGASAGASLESLTVNPPTVVTSADWLPALSGLSHLRLPCTNRVLRLPAGISRLTHLTDAMLGGSPLVLEGARLPTSLTRLVLNDGSSDIMPHQLSQLTGLQRLILNGSRYSPGSLAPLAALTALTRLELNQVHGAHAYLPAALPRLQALWLYLGSTPQDPRALDAALAQLQALTCLVVEGEALLRVPVGIAGLARLQRLCASRSADFELADASLPRGPWLGSIRWLGLPGSVLVSNVDALFSAPRLEYLCCLGPPCLDAEDGEEEDPAPPGDARERWDVLWEFASFHPPLRCLAFEAGEGAPADTLLLDGLLTLKVARPGLHLRRIAPHPGFAGEALDGGFIPWNPHPYAMLYQPLVPLPPPGA